MPVYHLTLHAYGTWHEDHPNGYVQRGEGLKQPSTKINKARRELQKHPDARFDPQHHASLYEDLLETAKRFDTTLHGVAMTPTHLHIVLSFHSPACVCGADAEFCPKTCPAYKNAAAFASRYKKNAGMTLWRRLGGEGRKSFSRGWHITPVRDRPHLDRLLQNYLPKHQKEHGTIWINTKS